MGSPRYININKGSDFWNTVIFTDESKFNIFGSDGMCYVWRKPNTELNKENLKPSVKHGSGNVTVWAYMSTACTGNLVFIEGNMNKNMYLDSLKNNFFQSAKKNLEFGKIFISTKTMTRSTSP